MPQPRHTRAGGVSVMEAPSALAAHCQAPSARRSFRLPGLGWPPNARTLRDGLPRRCPTRDALRRRRRMVWKPKGFITLREAVLRLAEDRNPTAGIRSYVAQPWPTVPRAGSDPIRTALATWDPFTRPRVDTNDPAWIAIADAHGAMQQALGDGELEAIALDEQSGTVTPIPCDLWRSDQGDRAVLTGNAEWTTHGPEIPWTLRGFNAGQVQLAEATFKSWLAWQSDPLSSPIAALTAGVATPAPSSPAVSQAALLKWYLGRVETWSKEAAPPSADQDLKAAKQRFPGVTVSRDAIRGLRRKHAPEEWRKAGRKKSSAD